MLEIAAILCLIAALGLLAALSAIDLKHGILPNELVLSFAVAGLVFHLSTAFAFTDISQIFLGAVTGGGLLYLIRMGATAFYGDDALGLGDVKLLAAGGIWLGPEDVLVGMTVGAMIGFLHGSIYALYTRAKSKDKISLSRLSIPAGPGFAAGLLIAAILKFRTLPTVLLP